MVKRRGVQIYKRRGSLACVASGVFFFSRVVRFSRLSFRNYLSCVFNCDDRLGRSVISSPRSSTEVIVVLLIKPTAF